MSKKVLGNKREGLLFVLSAPAGTGKSTLVEMLMAEFPMDIAESCSVTTRPPRPGEVSQKHYDFVTLQEFQKKIELGEFLEYANVFGHYYGTRKEEIQRLQAGGKHTILVIDTQGAIQIKEKIAAVSIFISPPSMEELRKRLFKRGTESTSKIEERLKWAEHEMEMKNRYDYHIINDDLGVSYQILRSIIIAEEHKNKSFSKEKQ